jgi:hypothetical protein
LQIVDLGSLTFDEFNALVREDIEQFELLTGMHLTRTDLRILSMDRYTSLERTIGRPLSTVEYRQLLRQVTSQSLDFIEREILCRSLTIDERCEYDEFVRSTCSTVNIDSLRYELEQVDRYDEKE